MSAHPFTGWGLRRHVARTGPAKLPKQDDQTVLVLRREIRPTSPGLQRQVTNLAALIGRESIPILPTLCVQPKDRGEDSAPRDLPNGGDGLQDPGWHRCRCGYSAPGTSNGGGCGRGSDRRSDVARSILTYAEALRQCDQEDCGDDADYRADGVELKDVALADGAGDDPAEQRGRPHSSAATAPHARMPGYGTCAVSSPTAQEGGTTPSGYPRGWRPSRLLMGHRGHGAGCIRRLAYACSSAGSALPTSWPDTARASSPRARTSSALVSS